MLQSRHAIERGPFRDFEIKKETQRLTGYTMFLSHFFVEWKKLPHEVRLEHLGGFVEDADWSDYDSVDSPIPIAHADVIRHAASKWNALGNNLKHSWGVRAARVNALPVLGKFTKVPLLLN